MRCLSPATASSDTLFVLRRPYGDPLERRVPSGGAGFSCSEKCFYDFSLLGARQLHRPCLANRFLTVSVSHGGVSLIPFSFSISVVVSCFA